MKTVAVVLAAGKSERMGQNKLLMKLSGKRLIFHIIEALAASKVDEIIVVLGNKPWEIEDVLKAKLNRIKIVVNEEHEEGMTSSFKIGLKQIEDADAALLVLGDQLILNPKLVNDMIEKMERNISKAFIVSPIHKGKRGHPVLFSKELFDEILSLRKNMMIREVIHRHSDLLLTVKADRWTTRDIDTPKDFVMALRLLEENLS